MQICIGNYSKQYTRCYFGSKSIHTLFLYSATHERYKMNDLQQNLGNRHWVDQTYILKKYLGHLIILSK